MPTSIRTRKRIPFYWYPNKDLPKLTDEDGLEKLTAMAKDVDTDAQLKFDQPLRLIVVDTLMTSAGYGDGGENSTKAVQEVMEILQKLSRAADVAVLAIDHYGKNENAGTRGASNKEDAVDVVLSCLGKLPDGSVPRPIFNVRKVRGARQGQRYPFTYHEVVTAVLDEDGEPERTLVLDFGPLQTSGSASSVKLPTDPWEKARQESTRTYALRLKQVMTEGLKDHGGMRSIDGWIRCARWS